MSDIFTLELTVTSAGSVKMVVSAGTFALAVIEADKEFTRWWEHYKTTGSGVSAGANRRSRPEILNVALVHRYRRDLRFCHISIGLRDRLNAV